MSKSRISRGGMAPPHGLIRPARSSSSDRTAAPRQVGRRRGAGRPAADHDHIEGLAHVPSPSPSADADGIARRRLRDRPLARGRGLPDPGREAGRDEEQQRLGGEHRAVGQAGEPMQPAGEIAGQPCRQSRRARTRSPAPRPKGPSRTPSRASRPAPARLIIEPMAATAKAPLATPSTKTDARSGQPGPTMPAIASASSATAEATQPPMVQARSDADAPAAGGAAGQRHQHHAEQARRHAARRTSCVDSPGRQRRRRGRRTARGSGPARCRPASRRRRRW